MFIGEILPQRGNIPFVCFKNRSTFASDKKQILESIVKKQRVLSKQKQ